MAVVGLDVRQQNLFHTWMAFAYRLRREEESIVLSIWSVHPETFERNLRHCTFKQPRENVRFQSPRVICMRWMSQWFERSDWFAVNNDFNTLFLTNWQNRLHPSKEQKSRHLE